MQELDSPPQHYFFPSLPPLTNIQVLAMQKSFSYDKAQTFDGFSDKWIRNTERWDLLSDMWNNYTVSKLKDSLIARLIPLNKVWPDIPQPEQFRPIVVLSPIYKWLELRFLDKLRGYLANQLDTHQTGFVPGCGTHLNIQLLLEKLRESKKKDGMCCLFIDFKSAYNTINRQKLYELLIRKGILELNEVLFLQTLHSLLHFQSNDNKQFYFKNEYTNCRRSVLHCSTSTWRK